MNSFKFILCIEIVLVLTMCKNFDNSFKSNTCYGDSVEEINNLISESIETDELIVDSKKDIKFIQSFNNNISYENAKSLTNIVKNEIINYDWIEYEFYLSLCGQESKFKKISMINNNLICNIDSFLGAEYGRGVAQVSEIGLLEYNIKNNTDYLPEDLYNVEINIKISMWLLNKYHHGYDYDGNYFERSVENTSLIYNNGYVVIRGTEQQKSKCNFNYYKDIMNLYKSWVD